MKKENLLNNQKGITTLVLVIILVVAVLVTGVIAYLFFFRSGNGILSGNDKKEENNLIEPKISLEVDEDTNDAVEVIVTITASTDDEAGIKGIRLPSGSVIENEKYQYKITENGDYTFYAIGNNGKEVSEELTVANIVKPSATEPYIPEGFEHITGTVEEGYVIKDKYNNEFVWIPVATGRLERNTNFSTDYQEPTTTLTNSVAKYYGFYVARYEASRSAGNRVAIVPSATPWTNISYTDAEKYSSNMVEDYKYDEHTKTALVNSYAWDTLLSWIDTSIESYSSKLDYGNYSGEIAKTGETTSDIVKNIADLSGNVREWTTEMYTKVPTPTATPKSNNSTNTNNQSTEQGSYQRVIRGGSASISKTAASHSTYYENQTDDYWGFRVILYKE